MCIRDSISTSQPKGHAPLSIKFAMTAPAEGGRLSGKKVDLTCAGIGPCGSTSHLIWWEDGTPKQAKHSITVTSPKAAGTVLAESMTKARINEYASIDKLPVGYKQKAFDKVSFFAVTAGTEVAAKGLGLDLVFDAIYRAGFSRKKHHFNVTTCGNPAKTVTDSGTVDILVYPSEKYKISLTWPAKASKSVTGKRKELVDSQGNLFENNAKVTSEEETPGFKLKVDDRDHATSVDFTKYIVYARQAETVTDTVKSIFKVVPALGFWIEGSVKILSGSVSVAWQWQEVREREVQLWWQLEGELTLIEASISFNYGFKVLAQSLKAALKITGAFKLKASAGSEGVVAPSYKEKTLLIPAEGSIEVEVGLYGDVAVVKVSAGISLTLKASGGIKIVLSGDTQATETKGGRFGLDIQEVGFERIVGKVSIKVEKVWEYNREVPLTDSGFVLFKGVS